MDTNKAKIKSFIKKQRIKSYFLESAKEIILDDGPESITVRKIADLAGYSYGTIYNYYIDLNELLLEVKNLMIGDIVSNMNKYMTMELLTVQDIKMLNHEFADYFIANPNIYRFLYNYQLKEIGETPFDNLDIGQAYWHTYKGIVAQGIINKEDVPIVAKTMVYGLYGLLSLYFSSNGLTKEKIYADLDHMIEYILKGN